MITTSQFQERLIEYLDGELPEAERREVEEYLRAHPEAAEFKGDLALLSEAGRSIRQSSYPANLLLEANRALAARLAARSSEAASSRGAVPAFSGNGSPEMSDSSPAPRSRRWRPRALAAVLAGAAVLLAGAVSQKAAIAEVASSLLHRISLTIDGEPLSSEQQQQLREFIQVTDTLESDDRVVTVDVNQARAPLDLPDGVLMVEVSDPDSLEGGDMIRVRSGSGPPPRRKDGRQFPGRTRSELGRRQGGLRSGDRGLPLIGGFSQPTDDSREYDSGGMGPACVPGPVPPLPSAAARRSRRPAPAGGSQGLMTHRVYRYSGRTTSTSLNLPRPRSKLTSVRPAAAANAARQASLKVPPSLRPPGCG